MRRAIERTYKAGRSLLVNSEIRSVHALHRYLEIRFQSGILVLKLCDIIVELNSYALLLGSVHTYHCMRRTRDGIAQISAVDLRHHYLMLA